MHHVNDLQEGDLFLLVPWSSVWAQKPGVRSQANTRDSNCRKSGMSSLEGFMMRGLCEDPSYNAQATIYKDVVYEVIHLPILLILKHSGVDAPSLHLHKPVQRLHVSAVRLQLYVLCLLQLYIQCLQGTNLSFIVMAAAL